MPILAQLIAESFQLYKAATDPVVVRPSIPILYFGDSQAYFDSSIKVITVALNPSRAEFPPHNRFLRFPAARPLGDGQPVDAPEGPPALPGRPEGPPALPGRPEALIGRALDSYFRERPYRSWFNPSFEYLLNGLGVSFCGGERGTALHTDIGSPLATDPTWNGLRDDQREALRADGVPLWHRLVNALDPDVIVVSTAAHHLDKITFAEPDSISTLCTFTHRADGTPRKQPYVVRQQRVWMVSGRQALLVYGRAANKPFGTVSRIGQQTIGQAIGEVLDGR